jgi:hypothetical protein
MNDFYSCSSVVLAHGFDISRSSGINLLIVMPLLVLVPLIYKKSIKVLFVSSIIPYVLVLISILQVSFELKVPDETTAYICFAAAFYLNFPLIFIVGMNGGFFFAAFIVDTLIIFAIIRLVLFVKQKVSSKEPQVKQEI